MTTRTDADVERLAELVAAMRSAELEYPQFNALDTEFHVTVARISGNPLSASLMQALRGAVESEMSVVFARLPDWRAVADAVTNEHESILRAIEKGDVDAADELVGGHIERFYTDQIMGG